MGATRKLIRSLGSNQYGPTSQDRIEEYDLTFPTAREEHLDNKHLQSSHRNHKPALQQAEPEYSAFGAADSAEVPVLARTEVFLLSYEGGYLAGKLQNRLFDAGELLRGRAGFLGEAGTGFVFDLCGASAVSAERVCGRDEVVDVRRFQSLQACRKRSTCCCRSRSGTRRPHWR